MASAVDSGGESLGNANATPSGDTEIPTTFDLDSVDLGYLDNAGAQSAEANLAVDSGANPAVDSPNVADLGASPAVDSANPTDSNAVAQDSADFAQDALLDNVGDSTAQSANVGANPSIANANSVSESKNDDE